MIVISVKASVLSCPWQLDCISKENNEKEKECINIAINYILRFSTEVSDILTASLKITKFSKSPRFTKS